MPVDRHAHHLYVVLNSARYCPAQAQPIKFGGPHVPAIPEKVVWILGRKTGVHGSVVVGSEVAAGLSDEGGRPGHDVREVQRPLRLLGEERKRNRVSARRTAE